MYDDNRNGRITCAEARAHGIAPVHRGHPAYQYMRDGDGDGVVCEYRTHKQPPPLPPPKRAKNGLETGRVTYPIISPGSTA